MAGQPWSGAEVAWFADHPQGSYWDFVNVFGSERTYHAWRLKRGALALQRGAPRPRPLRRREDTPPDMPPVAWDKVEEAFHWTDVIAPATALQAIAKASSGSQDFAQIVIETDRPTPVLFISDWHFGSWGTSLERVAAITRRIIDEKIHIACLGDMLQLAIVMRNMLEVSDNMLPPRLQMKFLESWLADVAPLLLWSTWDNHAVMREEKLSGFSHYAELFKKKVVYHSGIGHIDLTVGGQTYKIASAHRFRGNSYMNPTHGQMRYARFEGPDRELIVAGDSHRPAHQVYTDGPMTRIAINCGTLQTDSGFAKRHFSLYTCDAMPIVVFHPDRHLMVPYWSLDAYEASRAVAE